MPLQLLAEGRTSCRAGEPAVAPFQASVQQYQQNVLAKGTEGNLLVHASHCPTGRQQLSTSERAAVATGSIALSGGQWGAVFDSLAPCT